MADIPKFPKLDLKKIERDIYLAIERIYVKELIQRTPTKTGITANSWDLISLGNFNYMIINPHGDIITYLEEGTRAHTIFPKTKKFLKFQIEKEPTLRNPKEQKAFREKKVIFFFKGYRNPILGFSYENGKYYCYAKKVKHPGIVAHHFIKEIIESRDLYKKFEDEVLKSIKI